MDCIREYLAFSPSKSVACARACEGTAPTRRQRVAICRSLESMDCCLGAIFSLATTTAAIGLTNVPVCELGTAGTTKEGAGLGTAVAASSEEAIPSTDIRTDGKKGSR